MVPKARITNIASGWQPAAVIVTIDITNVPDVPDVTDAANIIDISKYIYLTR